MALVLRRDPNSYYSRLTTLKKLFWLYFILLIFEGALRKWVAPQLSAPLLIIRDPIGIWIIWEAYRTNKWPQRWTGITALLTVSLISLFVVQLVIGDMPWFAGAYGLRSYLLPFPVLFIMGENLDEEDVRKLVSFTLLLLPFEAGLEVAQYASPGSSILNRGAYEGGSQIGFAQGHLRASGTFSFNVGAQGFEVLAAAFFFHRLVGEGFRKKWMLWVSAFSLVISLPMMGSRGVLYELIAMVGCMALAASMGVSQFGRALRVIVPVMVVGLLASQLPVFSDATANVLVRFASKGSEGGDPVNTPIYRTVGPFVDELENRFFSSSMIGIGMGRSAIAVQAFMTGEPISIAGEGDFPRLIAEMGPIMGLLYQLFRFGLATVVMVWAVRRTRDYQPLALLLAPLALSDLMLASFEQTTNQGFMVVSLALMIAASKRPISAIQPAFVHPVLRRQVVQRSRLYKG